MPFICFYAKRLEVTLVYSDSHLTTWKHCGVHLYKPHRWDPWRMEMKPALIRSSSTRDFRELCGVLIRISTNPGHPQRFCFPSPVREPWIPLWKPSWQEPLFYQELWHVKDVKHVKEQHNWWNHHRSFVCTLRKGQVRSMSTLCRRKSALVSRFTHRRPRLLRGKYSW